MHLKDEIIKDTNRVEIMQTPLQRMESSRALQDLLGREKDAIRTQQAARMLELEKKLAEYREKYGVFPGGKKAAREVLLSKKSGANEKISQTVRTILETKATPEEMVPDIMELAMEGKYSCEEASREVVADACEMMLGDSTVVEQLAKENRSLAEKIRDWLREWVENLKIALEGLQADRTESRAMMQYARELQEIWDNALMDAARNNRGATEETAPAESRQSIRETSDGKKYVKADRQVLFGSDPDSWSEQLEDYINGKIRRGQDVQLIAEDGDVLLLTRTSAGKLSDNHTSDGRTMSDAAFERKANAAAHIDELVEVSSKGKKTIIDKDARHGDMASGGWNYRTAYFMDFDGKYYKTTISVAEGAGGSIVYNVGKMQERSTPQIDGSSGKAGALRGNASTNSIRQSNDNSQEKSSDNKTPTADPDIRYQQRDNLKEEYHLTDDEESAIISYKSGDSYTLNGKLTARAELTEYQRKLRDNLDAALEKLPVYRGEVYRHYNFDDFGGFEAMRGFLKLFKKDEIVDLHSYLSCSTVRNEDRTGGKYTVNMVIQSESGRRLAGFGRNTENEILLPRNIRLVPYRMERVGLTSIRIYAREEIKNETGETADSTLSSVRGVREGSQGSKDLRQVSGRNPEEVQREMGRHAGRDGNRGGMPGLREGEGSASLDATGVAENHRGLGTRGGEGEGVKNQQREPRLSDRDVLRRAADLALNDRKMNFTQADRERLKIFKKRLDILDEKQTQRQGYLQTKRDILSNSARLF